MTGRHDERLDPAPTKRDRWRTRRSSRLGRRVLTVAYLLGFALWCVFVYVWAGDNGHRDWQEGTHTVAGLVAAMTYWPLALASWWLLYQGDPRGMPWERADDD